MGVGSGKEGQGREGRDVRVNKGPAVAEPRPGHADGCPSHDHFPLFAFSLFFLFSRFCFLTVVTREPVECGARQVIGPEHPNKG